MTGRLYYWVANWSLSRAQAALLLGRGAVADMADCTHAALPAVIKAYPTIRRFGGYVTGSPDIRWTAEDFDHVAVRPGAVVLRIDQSDLDLPLRADVKLAKDVEQGASLIGQAVHVAGERLRAGEDYSIYIEQSELHQLEDAIAATGMPAGEIAAYQYASPSSNPNTRLPGTTLTLREANADLSVVRADWLPIKVPDRGPNPHPAGTFHAALTFDERDRWTVHGTPAGGVKLGGPDVYDEARVGVNRRTGDWRVSPLPAEKAVAAHG